MRKALPLAIIAVLGTMVALFLISPLSYSISRWMRQRVAAEIQQLARRFENDPTDTEALDSIREIVRDDSSFARTYACGALRRLGPKAAAATPELINALQSGDPFVEREAALALGEVAIGRADVVQALIDALKYEDRDVGWFAAEALGKIGPVACSAVPALERSAQSDNEMMLESASKAVQHLKACCDR